MKIYITHFNYSGAADDHLYYYGSDSKPYISFELADTHGKQVMANAKVMTLDEFKLSNGFDKNNNDIESQYYYYQMHMGDKPISYSVATLEVLESL